MQEREWKDEGVEKWKGEKSIKKCANEQLTTEDNWGSILPDTSESTENTLSHPTKGQGNWGIPVPYWEHELPGTSGLLCLAKMLLQPEGLLRQRSACG